RPLRVSEVSPAQLDPSWPTVPPEPASPHLSTEARNALPFEATRCPSCGAEVAKPPKGRKRCLACGVYMYVSVIDRKRRRLVTEADAAKLGSETDAKESAEWDAAERRWCGSLRHLGFQVVTDPSEAGIELDVVGESHYHADLAALMAALRADSSFSVLSAARLVREPTNRYDRNAVRVEVHGRVVGYLSREDAAEIRPWITKHDRRGAWFVLARLGGGRIEDGLVGPIGVTIENLPDDALD
ncbi:MAG: HIRAN domain-containing protein, partial [bacterium]